MTDQPYCEGCGGRFLPTDQIVVYWRRRDSERVDRRMWHAHCYERHTLQLRALGVPPNDGDIRTCPRCGDHATFKTRSHLDSHTGATTGALPDDGLVGWWWCGACGYYESVDSSPRTSLLSFGSRTS